MKPIAPTILCILVLASNVFPCSAQSPGPVLRLERHTNAVDLTVSSLSTTGALFVFQATNLEELANNPSLLLETNTVSTNDLQMTIPPPLSPANQGFFSAAHWPGFSTNDFLDSEEYPIEPVPDKILFTSDLPPNLGDGMAFTVDFFVADPTGQPVAISGAATILVVRESDGAVHPDATVTPSSAQMTNGYMRVVITVNSTTSLGGYTLGLSIEPGVLGSPHPLVSSTFLKAAFGLGPAPLTPPQVTYYSQQLEQRRLNNADSGTNWDDPLGDGLHAVSGTFGEWRGKRTRSEPTGHVHEGLDLSTGGVADTNVLASRGGVISRRGSISGMGDYLVVDHGTGWFSRYLHLDPTSILVTNGQAVARGATLATRLYSRANWSVHLHFEVWHTSQNVSQWESPYPGVGQDPLQTAGMFSVRPASNLPRLEEFGLTHEHPGQTAFLKNPPTSDGGPVYLFAKFVDLEAGNRLALRAMRFLPELAAMPQEIRPTNQTIINLLRPPGTGQTKGFAKYPNNHFYGRIPQSEARTNYYWYWWKWDTSVYTNDIGPRNFVLTGVGYSSLTTNYTFTFGPRIQLDSVRLEGNQQYVFTNVAYLGTNTTALSQPDQYKVQIIQTNGQPLTNVTWDSPLENYPDYALTPVVKTHLQTNGYSFKLPANTDAAGLKLRLSSRLVPDIADAFPLDSWVRYYELGDYQVHALAVDGSGNVIVTGRPVNNYVGNYTTIKYSPTGMALWTNRYTNTDADSHDFGLEPAAVAVDSSGNVFVTGHSIIWTNDDTRDAYATLAYSSAGVPIWTNYYAATNDFGAASPKAVAVDNGGNVIVTGSIGDPDSSQPDYVTIKYSRAGIPLWTKRYDGGYYTGYNSPGGPGYYISTGDYATAVAVDSRNNVIVTGFSGGTNAADYLTIKYSPTNGVPLWTKRYDAGYNDPDYGNDYIYAEDFANALAVDSSDNVIVTGSSCSSDSGKDVYVTIKYSSAGVPLWTKRYDGDTLDIYAVHATAVAVDSSNNVIVTGWPATIKYSPAGVPLWTNIINTDTDLAAPTSVAVDSGGNVFVAGGKGNPSSFTIAYSGAGVPLWTTRLIGVRVHSSEYNYAGDPGYYQQDYGSPIAVDGNGNVFVTGTLVSRDREDGYGFFTVKYGSVLTPETEAQSAGGANSIRQTSAIRLKLNRTHPAH